MRRNGRGQKREKSGVVTAVEPEEIEKMTKEKEIPNDNLNKIQRQRNHRGAA